MKPKQTVMILDCNFLCWRAYHTTQGLTYNNVETGLNFGFFKDLLTLEQTLGTCNHVFCWDSGKLTKRHEILPTYKEKRQTKNLDEDELKKVKKLRKQMRVLRDEILPALGFKNVMKANGYEADDLIAAACTRLTLRGHSCVIVSADKDLYQLLGDQVSMWNPISKKTFTAEAFRAEWGIEPHQWKAVKAIAGCSTDQVPGVTGVGEKTAAKYVAKTLKAGAKFDAIKAFIQSGEYSRNLRLVQLPFTDCPSRKIDPCPGPIDQKQWVRFCADNGFESLKGKLPGSKTGFGLIPKRRT